MIKKVLVPVDGSDLATKAIPYAEEVADKYNAELILVWVLHPLLQFSEEAIEFYEAVRQVERDAAKTYLRTAPFSPHKLHVQTRTKILEGPVAQTIIDMAREESVDLIVMSTHGRSGLGRWVYGSVAAKVLEHAPCPILLVRASAADR